MTTNLFGEQQVQIKGNSVLSQACNRLLAMHAQQPQLFDGDEVGKINRRLYAEILWEDGIQKLIPSNNKESFLKVITQTQEADVFSRALRSMVYDLGLIKLSATAIRNAEQMRNRLQNFK